MDFLETLFGFAPDGSDGTFELLLFALPMAGIVALSWWRRRRGAARRNGERR
jgi:hypothetical protein